MGLVANVLAFGRREILLVQAMPAVIALMLLGLA
jgi:uncharacterized membrane protein